MVKKKVPDWLNSSLWSSSHSPPSTIDAPTEDTSAVAAGPSEPPHPPPSPPTVVEDPPETQRIEDSRPKDHTPADAFSSSPSADDISRQAELLAEVVTLCFNWFSNKDIVM